MPVPGTDGEVGVMGCRGEGFLACHVEWSETSLAVAFTLQKRAIQRFFASIRTTMSVLA